MVESSGLENRHTRDGIVGSNLTPSATYIANIEKTRFFGGTNNDYSTK